jgi:flagellar biosynthesis/type III secretory pathway chaperone
MPVSKQTLQDLFDSLEAVLVNTFRLCESLHQITQQERQALLEGNLEALQSIIKQKENIVVEVESNDGAREVITKQLIQALGIDGEVNNLGDLIVKAENSVDVSKIIRLRQGILALQAEIRELNNSNYALAVAKVERLDAIQEYIIGLFAPPVSYRPNVKIAMSEPPTSWGNDHMA